MAPYLFTWYDNECQDDDKEKLAHLLVTSIAQIIISTYFIWLLSWLPERYSSESVSYLVSYEIFLFWSLSIIDGGQASCMLQIIENLIAIIGKLPDDNL